MVRLHFPHAIVVRLHACQLGVVILTEVFGQQFILVGWIYHLDQSHGHCPVRDTRDSLPCGRYLLVRLTPTRSPINVINNPIDSILLRSTLRLWCSCGASCCAKSLSDQDQRLAISPQLATRLHLSHAIVVGLHLRKSNVVILTPETAGTVGV